MEGEPLPLFRLQLSLYLGTLVSAVIVQDEVHFLVGRELSFQMVEAFSFWLQ